MLVQQAVNYKKAISSVVTSTIIILISITALILVWNYTQPIISKSPAESAICLNLNLEIKKVCYLNENEIKLELTRGFDNLQINKLIVGFSPDTSNWQIEKKRCLDIRLETGEYGSYCDLIEQGTSKDYVFNMTGTSNETSVRILAYINDVNCELSRQSITSC